MREGGIPHYDLYIRRYNDTTRYTRWFRNLMLDIQIMVWLR